MTHYTAAAQQGHATADNNLGSMYAHGQGVRRNLVEAVRWYRAAADHGEVSAQCNLASLYFRGSGVGRDYREAASWFRAAAERGHQPEPGQRERAKGGAALPGLTSDGGARREGSA